MRGVFRRDCFLKARATLAFVQFTTLLWCSLLSIILTVWLLLSLFTSFFVTPFAQTSGGRLSRQDCSSPWSSLPRFGGTGRIVHGSPAYPALRSPGHHAEA